MRHDDPQGCGQFGPHGYIIDRIYVGYHQILLHTKNTGLRSCGFR